MSNTKYQSGQEQPLVASEPVASYGTMPNRSVYVSKNETNRGITGEELLSRLRPRIKSLFS